MKTHKITTINDLVNILTLENHTQVIEDMAEFISTVARSRELAKHLNGTYPENIVKSLEIVFDGKTGLKELTVDDQITFKREE